MAKLQVGDPAPDFSAVTQEGKTIHLSDFRGKRAVVLFFYPKDGSPICTKEACAFRDSYEQFLECGAQVIGVSGDSTGSHRSFVDQHRLPFTLISDVNGSTRRTYGASSMMGLLPGRVTFVIDRQGIIRMIFSSQFATNEHVKGAIEALRKLDHSKS